jgi:predicted PurR-regulated permease PerM
MAVGGTVATLFVVLVVAAVLIAPTLGHELATSVLSLPNQLDTARQQAVGEQLLANDWLTQHAVPLQIDLVSNDTLDSLAKQTMAAAPAPLALVGGAAGAVGGVGMMLLLSVFFLLGGPPLAEEVIHTFDGQAAADVRYVLTAVHDAFEGFLRAQFLQAALYTAGVWVCLEVAHVGPAPLVSVVAGVMLLVPVVGAAFAVAVPLLATLLLNPDALIPVAVAVVLLEQIVLNVVGPRLMGKQLGLPPLVVLFGILAGGQIGGFWGAIFGIPVLATLQMCLSYFRSRWAPRSMPELSNG